MNQRKFEEISGDVENLYEKLHREMVSQRNRDNKRAMRVSLRKLEEVKRLVEQVGFNNA